MRRSRACFLGSWILAIVCVVASGVTWSRESEVATDPLPLLGQKVSGTEVLLEVVVQDRSGKPVEGLEKEDFEVFLEGQPQEIESTRYLPWGPEPELTKGPPGIASSKARHRYFILLFHDLIFQDLIFLEDKSLLGLLNQRMRAARGIRRWVNKELQEGDMVAIASYDSRLHLYLDFTEDENLVVEALERVLGRLAEEPLSADEPRIGAYLPSGRELLERTSSLQDALGVLATAAGHTPARKHLLLFTVGTDLVGNQSRDLFGEPWQQAALKVIQHNEVIVYPLDLTPRGAEHPLLGGLLDLAETTGGTCFTQFTDFHKPLRSISEGLAGYYLIAFSTNIVRKKGEAVDLNVRSRHHGHQASYRRALLTEARQIVH